MIHFFMIVGLIVLAPTALGLGINDAGAPGVKSLIQDALKEGKAEGMIDGMIAGVFQNATSSKEPVMMKVTRIKQYANGCGRLHFEIIQEGVKADDGKLVKVNPAFELSMCPNGQPPKEVREEYEQHRREALRSCKATTIRGDMDKSSGVTSGNIRIAGCPASGKLQLKYTGSCPAIQMPTGVVVNYELDSKGGQDIQLRIPSQCTNTKPPHQNQWSLVMIEKGGLVLGDVVTAW